MDLGARAAVLGHGERLGADVQPVPVGDGGVARRLADGQVGEARDARAVGRGAAHVDLVRGVDRAERHGVIGDRVPRLVDEAHLERLERQGLLRLRRAGRRAERERAAATRRGRRGLGLGGPRRREARDEHRAHAALLRHGERHRLQELAVDGDLGVELVAGRDALEEHAAAGVGLQRPLAHVAARVLDDGRDVDATTAFAGILRETRTLTVPAGMPASGSGWPEIARRLGMPPPPPPAKG